MKHQKMYALFALLCLFSYLNAALVINEIVSSNGATIADEDGNFEDWVEIFNSSSEAVQLQGISLTDNLKTPKKWTFPQYTLKSGEYLVVFASGKDRASGKYFHTNFSISAEGEPLLLTSPAGDTLDIITAVVIPRDVSYGRAASGNVTFSFFSKPTPGSANSTSSFTGLLNPPVFSHQAGFYTKSISLSLSSSNDGASIYYTIDGSVPDPANLNGLEYSYKLDYRVKDELFSKRTFRTFLYKGPITVSDRTSDTLSQNVIKTTYDTTFYIPKEPVFKGVTVRAIAVKDGALPSPVQTRTYLVDTTQTKKYPVQIVSIAMPETSLFKYETGIYVPGKVFDDSSNSNSRFGGMGNPPANYNRSGDEWERDANFELFNERGEEQLNQMVGIRIHGGWTRAALNKSLRIYARNRFGQDEFKYQFFDTKNINRFKTILLRNSGNDHNYTRFRDAFIQSLVSSLKIDQQASRPVVFFLNGEYWGVMNIRDRLDKYYLQNHYNLNPDSIDIMCSDLTSRSIQVVEGDDVHYNALLEHISSNDIRDSAVYAKLGTMMDIENFAAYQAIQIFSRNTDWPQNNSDWWRYRTDSYKPGNPYGLDGRWRWMLYDLDFGFGLWRNTADHNTLEYASCSSSRNCQTWATQLFSTLLKNDNFRITMINTFADLMNTVFKTDTVVQKLEKMKAVYAPLMSENIQRWGSPKTYSKWETYVDTMMIFVKARRGYMITHIMKKFAIDDTVTVSLNVAEGKGGTISINTVPTTGTAWKGTYFKGIPITVKAVPAKGYAFSHWDGSLKDSSVVHEFVPEKECSLTANFIQTGASTRVNNSPLIMPVIKSVAVFNCKGQRVALLSGNTFNKNVAIRSLRQGHLPAGIYYFKMTMQNGVLFEPVSIVK